MGNNTERSTGVYTGIDQDEDSLLAADLMAQVPRMLSSNCSIFRVPRKLRYKGDEKVYEPSSVSIGPYHHGKEDLKAMEEHKVRYLHSLVSRLASKRIVLKDIVKATRELQIDARGFYAETINLSSNEFVRMMVLDSCFIIELLYRNFEPTMMNDPVFTSPQLYSSVRVDLALLENQLPFNILDRLFNLTKHPNTKYSFSQLVISFMYPGEEYKTSKISRHILDILRNRLVPFDKQIKEHAESPFEFIQYSAIDLWEAGVIFKKKQRKDNLLDITFSDEGVLEIPSFHVTDGCSVIISNMVALEQCRRDYTSAITSYVILLDGLINSKDDVKLLREKEIINIMWKEDDLIAAEITKLCSKGAFLNNFFYSDLCHRLNVHCRTDWNKWRATLNRKYFKTPWAALSVAAAILLLLLTFLQTLFSIPKAPLFK